LNHNLHTKTFVYTNICSIQLYRIPVNDEIFHVWPRNSYPPKDISRDGYVFTGYLYGEALASVYASADVFVFTDPSKSFGQVGQEAMASALPSVNINKGGIIDLVQDRHTGYVCPEEPQAFAAAVNKRQSRTAPAYGLSRSPRS
jgi:glycosyltransferase involved in cell wall biosynthesis